MPKLRGVCDQRWDSSPRPLLSADGRTLFVESVGGLFDIDTGKQLWNAASVDEVTFHHPQLFETSETWRFEFGDWTKVFTPYTVRELISGKVAYRCWDFTLHPHCIDENAAHFVDFEGRVISQRDSPSNPQAVFAAHLSRPASGT